MAQVETEHSVRGQDPLVVVTEHAALRNPLVLNHILGYCPVADLKSCRLVSSFWRSSALTSWKKSALVKIETSERTKFLTFLRSLNTHDTHQLYVNYSLRNLVKSTNFWRACRGGHLTSLELIDCQSFQQKYFRQVIFRDCPNLRHLTLASLNIKSGRNSTLEVEEFEVYPSCEYWRANNPNLKISVKEGPEPRLCTIVPLAPPL